LKPEIHKDEAVGELTDSAFRVFIALITLADDYGRMRGDPRLISAEVWPYHPRPAAEVDVLIDELAKWGLVRRYSNSGREFLYLPSWDRHQRIDQRRKPLHPSPPAEIDRISPKSSETFRKNLLEKGVRSKEKGVRSKEHGNARGRNSSEEGRLFSLLAVLIERNGSPRPELTEAAFHEERILLNPPGRTVEQAEQLIRYAQGEKFWQPIITSLAKLDKHWDQLRLQAERGKSKGMANAHQLAREAERIKAEEGGDAA